MRILLPTMRDVGQVGGTTTHLDMLSRGLNEIGHEAHVLYLGAKVPAAARNLASCGRRHAEPGAARLGHGVRVLAARAGDQPAHGAGTGPGRGGAGAEGTARSGWEVLNAQDVYSVPGLRVVADRFSLPSCSRCTGTLSTIALGGLYRRFAVGPLYLVRSELTACVWLMRSSPWTPPARFRLSARSGEGGGRLCAHELHRHLGLLSSWEGREELRRKWDIPQERTVLFCPRRLVKKNGVVYPSLALAASRLRNGAATFCCTRERAANGTPSRRLREQGLSGEVRLLGNQDRQAIVELYRLSDVVLVPSIHSENVEEATSLAALEAMASGRPLIAGAVGGLAEIVRDGHNGLLVPGGDAEALAHAIRTLSDSSELRLRLSQAARDYVVATHSHLTAAESS